MSRPYLSYLSPRGDRADDRVDDAVDDELDYDYGYDYDGFADYDDYPPDRRWLWVAGVAGVVLLVAVVGTAVILGGGDSGSVSATVAPTTPRTVIATPTASAPSAPSATSSPPATSLPPETLTTVTPIAERHRRADPGTGRGPRGESPHGGLPGDRQPPADRPGDRDLHRRPGRAADRRQRRAAVGENDRSQSGR